MTILTEPLVALDLFAGAGGWDVGCRRLGVEVHGVEIMPEAVATREANGFSTIFRDVWDGLFMPALVPPYQLLIASPPCQGYSMAGKGSGRKALDDVLTMIAAEAYKRPEALRDYSTHGVDDRDVLVLTPLAYIWRDMPDFVALEQVPAVLPVWEAYGDVMRAWGYTVDAGLLHAEQYGVPQTRKRAILVARRGNVQASLPTPTHSRYHSRTPERLDAGVHKWVSMYEALQFRSAWGMTERPYPTVSGGAATAGGGPDRLMLGGSGARKIVAKERKAGRWVEPTHFEEGELLNVTQEEAAALQSFPGYEPSAAVPGDTSWCERRPSPTIVSQFSPDVVAAPGFRRAGDGPRQSQPGSIRVDQGQAAALQSFPSAVKNMGAGMVERHGDRPGRAADQPAFTVRAAAGGGEPGGFKWSDGEKLASEDAATFQSFPAGVVLRNGNQANSARREPDAPAPTMHFGQRSNKVEWMDSALAEDPSASGVRLTPGEASAFQSFPHEPPFIWKGAKTKQFLQIGNAVPPLLATHVLERLLFDRQDVARSYELSRLRIREVVLVA